LLKRQPPVFSISPLISKSVQPAGTPALVTLGEALGPSCVWVGAVVAPIAGETSTVCVRATVLVTAPAGAGVVGSVMPDVAVTVAVSATLLTVVGVTSIPLFALAIAVAVSSLVTIVGVGVDKVAGVASAAVPVTVLVGVTPDVAVSSLVEIAVAVGTAVAALIGVTVAGASADVVAAGVSTDVTAGVSPFVFGILIATWLVIGAVGVSSAVASVVAGVTVA